MDRKLTEFAALLRNNGLPVSPPEVADAVHAVHTVGYADRQRFHDALSCTLAKSLPHREVFERCFDNFFQFGLAPDNTASAPADSDTDTEQNGSPPPPLPGQGSAGSGSGGSSGGGSAASALGEQLMAGDTNALALALAQAVETARLQNIRVITQKGLFGRRLLNAMGGEALEAEISALDRDGSASAQRRAEALRQARQRLRSEIRDTVERYFQLARRQDRDAIMRDVDFATLREFRDVERVVQRMARRLITVHRRRDKLAARGLLDVKATLRHNVAYDGVLMQPRWRHIRKDRPRVMAVCDVSRSVSQHARFLLLFLYSLQEVIPKLRAFAFSSTLHEVTKSFERLPVEAAIDEVMDHYGFGSTDYGQAFRDLDDLARHDIDRRTTLIILGDARNNNGEAEANLLHQFHDRAKQVIWLNPEARNRWGSGDSEMLRYLPACTHAHSCRNLGDLERIVDRLLKSA
ncbi:MAG: VWA domain-containing protein [Moraxellaceae bacterium]|nr:VWA domain-containing protein [Moraxellaceae bacterium]